MADDEDFDDFDSGIYKSERLHRAASEDSELLLIARHYVSTVHNPRACDPEEVAFDIANFLNDTLPEDVCEYLVDALAQILGRVTVDAEETGVDP